ncbi:hypothetical protein [Oxynema aestuarii]|uniref:Uncharacterized protein n=1 Tax=Oxynema aestuarii AP17 TaxID=2064643 RepID=A0A6H1TXH3_9CYAN|nr:hypothetical protein [Oxynema aestuarii]QIZ70847.1 hypothetical protein HCG48_09840 [Oxynema aestuarii AP17]
MENDRQEQRRASEKAFIDSLHKLEETFQLVDEVSEPKPEKIERIPNSSSPRSNPSSPPKTSGFDLDELAEAAEDIEQFMKSKESQGEGD